MAVIGTAGWVALGSSALGAMGSSSGGGQQQTATKDPWAEAAPWLKQQIAQGQQLQNYYQQNPFNEQQKTAYQNTFNDLDNFRNRTAPGLMQFANNAMTGSYQRQSAVRPGMGAGYNPNAAGHEAGNQTPGGLLGGDDNSIAGLYKKYLGRAPEAAGAQYWQGMFGDTIDASEAAQFQKAAMPEMMRNGGPRAAPFGAGLLGSSYGQVNAGAGNPFTNGAMPPPQAPAAMPMANPDMGNDPMYQQRKYGYGSGGN